MKSRRWTMVVAAVTKKAVLGGALLLAADVLWAGPLAYDPDAGTLTEQVPEGRKPWIFPYSSEGEIGRRIQEGDSKVLDLRRLPEGMPPLKALGAGFVGGTAVEEIHLPADSIKRFGGGAFAGCRKLRVIDPLIPDSVSEIGPTWTFGDCPALTGTLVIGGSDGKIAALKKDNRFIFRNLSRIGAIVFGAGCDQSFFRWSYGGFCGAGSVTSIVCRVREPLDWSQGYSFPEACRTCLFQDMKSLKTVEVCGPLVSAAGLPTLPPGTCELRVPGESAAWQAFAAASTNVSARGLILKGNSLAIPEGYRLVMKPASPAPQNWSYAPKFPELTVDPDAKPIRNAADSSAFPIMGFAGSLVAECECSKRFYVDDRENTARIFRQAGVWLVRQWVAVDQWQTGGGVGRSRRKKPGYNGENYRCDMKDIFRFYKDYGIKAMLTLENYSVYTDPYNGTRTSDLKTVQKVICDYVRWICDNDFKSCVAGFELGNEPYWQGADLDKNSPEAYAARWIPIVKAIKDIWPEAPIGIALAEYMKGDPDVKAVRARMLSEKRVVRKDYFDESTLNQWSGRYVVAMKPVLDKIDHVIYHSYGGAIPESCSYCGIERFRNFTKAFPELEGKKFWITEWRERSDEDNRCHQRFHETLFKAGYMTMMVAQPDVDGLNIHQLNSLSGALYFSMASATNVPAPWCVSWDAATARRLNPRAIGVPEIEVGISGPVFRLFNEALMAHPLVMDFGSTKCGFQSEGKTNAIWAASKNYGDRKATDCQILVTMSAKKDSLALLAVNTRPVPAKLILKAAGKYSFCGPDYRIYSCPEEFLYRHELPGEGKFTKLYGYEQFPPPKDPYTVEIPANSVTTVTIPVRRGR